MTSILYPVREKVNQLDSSFASNKEDIKELRSAFGSMATDVHQTNRQIREVRGKNFLMIKQTGLTADYRSSISSLHDGMTTLKNKCNYIESVVEKLSKDVKGMCEPSSKSYSYKSQRYFLT